MNILYASSEVAPFAKTGGLADVAGALPPALARLGHDVRVIMPGYASINRAKWGIEPLLPEMLIHFPEGTQAGSVAQGMFPGTQLPVYFIEHDGYFGRDGLYQEKGVDYPDNAERFAFFSLASLWTVFGLNWRPDMICCNDWQTALIPTYLRNVREFVATPFFNSIKILFTIHNLAFHGLSNATYVPRLGLPLETFSMDGLEFFGHLNLLKGGIAYSDKISTVSPRYAQEIQTEEYGCGLDGMLRKRKADVIGILNGIDAKDWSPEHDTLIPHPFSADDLSGKALCKAHLQKKMGLEAAPDAPLIGVISRMTDQKGFDLIAEGFQKMMKLGVQFVLLGTGDKKYHEIFQQAAAQYPGRAAVQLAFDNQLAHEIEAGADMFLMPSRYEPCGLNQMYSLSYGTIPIVRETGGLADSITDYNARTARKGTGTGFVFKKYKSADLLRALRRAVSLYKEKPQAWRELQTNAMRQDHSWEASAKEYDEVFQNI